MIRDQFTLDLGNELIIDNFAGGGGTSTGLEAAFGRPVDIAINHDPEALAMHALNHPYTKHHCESVWDVDPIEVTNNRPVGLVWLSPDCKHFSKAKGGTPVSKHIRGLAWVGMRWVALTKPRVLMLENVEEFQTWGPVIIAPDGTSYPDPKRKGKTFQSFVRQLRQHGYKVDWRELRACDNGAPTIRKRLFLIARRDGLPIFWPEQTHAEPSDRRVLAGKLAPYRTAAECIDFSLPAESVFGRKRDLAHNTMRRVAKGLWRHVLTSGSPFIVGVGGRMGQSPSRSVHSPAQTITSKADSCVAQPVLAPYLSEHANASNQRTMPADAPLRTICAQVKGGHFSVVAPTLAPLRGTSEAHLCGHDVQAPLSTISAGGTHHGLIGAHLVTIGYGERQGQDARAQDIAGPLGTVVTANKHAMVAAHLTKFRTGSEGQSLDEPMPTVTANSYIKRPGGSAPLGIVAAHLTHLTHHGERAGTTPAEPLPTVTGANRGEQVLVTACMEQAYGGFYEDNDGRAADVPLSTVMSKGANQRLITAYLVKYYSEGGQDSACNEPMHTVPTKARMGLVETLQVPAATLAPEHVERARACAELLHEHLPEQFPSPADLVLMHHDGQWWVLVDITLRMLKPPELYKAQSFPDWYITHEIPNPELLFKDGVQVPGDPRLIPRIPLTITAQVRMCGNSVSPVQAEALTRTNFRHEQLLQRVVA
ncbi:DNA (cytosine-5)-methyltransferase 1 [Cupriavidus metallidurans]|uniref:DNA cytosine methyltransferase n=1 Tax=Cupriavidus metallidurans TaxID=119219 RepID=UPI0004936DDF|nr:DNA cytosine methyltransferase [Cupriavidus metallidurans]MDE4918304.1 DNA cytosine methyltransferase [Cupriavidus metallidurans]